MSTRTKKLHVAAVIDAGETLLGTRSFPTTRTGYRAMLVWIVEFGDLARIGVEGTGSYGAGLTQHLAKAGVTILEVDRPDRSDRRSKGKDDDLDAINAARPALHGRRTSIPKSKDGAVEACAYCSSPAPTRSGSAAAPYSSFECRSSPRQRNFATKSAT